VFAVDLPLAHAPRPPAPAGAAPARLAGLLVVAIDDDPSILQAMAFLLQGAGCEVVAARSGETARRALATATRAPDAIVCDYQLHGTSDGDGDGDGGAVIAHLREEFNAEIPALLVTGHTAGGAAEAAARDLGVPLLHKPLDAAALKAALETILHA